MKFFPLEIIMVKVLQARQSIYHWKIWIWIYQVEILNRNNLFGMATLNAISLNESWAMHNDEAQVDETIKQLWPIACHAKETKTI